MKSAPRAVAFFGGSVHIDAKSGELPIVPRR
jgi:hypothetical protein